MPPHHPTRRPPPADLRFGTWGGRVYAALWAVCLLLVAADLLYDKHGHFGFENLPGFHGAYGFVAFALLVLAGKQFRKLVMRDEDHYDRPPARNPRPPHHRGGRPARRA